MPGTEIYLDHDYVIDRGLNVYQVLGGTFRNWIIPVIKKYEVSRERVFLGKIGFGLKKVFEEYSPRVANVPMKRAFLDDIKALQPYITPQDVYVHYSPQSALLRLLRRVRDPLERDALDLAMELRGIGIGLDAMGIGGSVMMEAHNPRISDIDLVVYGCEAISAIREAGVIEPFRGGRLESWAISQSRRLGLPSHIVRGLYSPGRRGLYRGRPVSVIPVSRWPVWQTLPDMSKTQWIGRVEAILRLERGGCGYMYYPHVWHGRREAVLHGRNVREDAVVISYESLFSFISEETDRVKVMGVAYSDDEKTTIVVGGRESKSLIAPLAA